MSLTMSLTGLGGGGGGAPATVDLDIVIASTAALLSASASHESGEPVSTNLRTSPGSSDKTISCRSWANNPSTGDGTHVCNESSRFVARQGVSLGTKTEDDLVAIHDIDIEMDGNSEHPNALSQSRSG
jgi:hypothetical protein